MLSFKGDTALKQTLLCMSIKFFFGVYNVPAIFVINRWAYDDQKKGTLVQDAVCMARLCIAGAAAAFADAFHFICCHCLFAR